MNKKPNNFVPTFIAKEKILLSMEKNSKAFDAAKEHLVEKNFIAADKLVGTQTSKACVVGTDSL